MAGLHAVMGPSSAARICECPASYTHHDPDKEEPSTYATEGTAAHVIHERRLKQPKISGIKYLGEKIPVVERNGTHLIEVTVEMVNAVEQSIEKIKDILNDLRAEGLTPKIYVEQRVDITRWTPLPEQFGTADVIIVAPPKLVVIDYKNGVGVVVPAFENVQGSLYALGAFDKLKDMHIFTDVSIHIHQPNIGAFDHWSLSVEDLLAFGAAIRDKLSVAVSRNPHFGPSDKTCIFCSYKRECKARATAVQNTLAGCFDDVREPADRIDLAEFCDPTRLTSEDLGNAWRKIKMIEGWIADVKKECEHRLFIGDTDGMGLKIVEGRKSYTYKNEKKALKFLMNYMSKKDAFKIEMISVSAARTKLPSAARGVFNRLFVHEVPGKPTVALDSDKRSEHSMHSECFDDVTVVDSEDGLE